MAMSKLAMATFYGVSVSDASFVSMLLLSVRPRFPVCRALILSMSFNPPIEMTVFTSVRSPETENPGAIDARPIAFHGYVIARRRLRKRILNIQ